MNTKGKLMLHAVKPSGAQALVIYTRLKFDHDSNRQQQMSVFFVIKFNQLITEDTLFINQFVFLYFLSRVYLT
jgi:hypothetical protein